MTANKIVVDTQTNIDEGINLAPPIKVSQLIELVKNDIEKKHKFVRVIGEVSSFKVWRSGHCYFDIKDEKALMPAIMFKPHAMRVPFDVKDGLEVLFSGYLNVYAQNSRLQMVVQAMEPLGQGALALAFEQLKNRLLNEGLFDHAHKKPLKKLNQTIGIVTSSHGAALRDMVRILKNRMPNVSIILRSAKVQGQGAKEEIAQAILELDTYGECDLLIVGRGGGSLEDLWAFNEEIVARAIFNCKTPIISAVGHETDTSISDFVADVRAATPSHAAQLAVPKVDDLLHFISDQEKKLQQLISVRMKREKISLQQMKSQLSDPRILFFRHWQTLDQHNKKLSDAFRKIFSEKKNNFLKQFDRLKNFSPFMQLRLRKEKFSRSKKQLEKFNPEKKLILVRNNFENNFQKLNLIVKEIFKNKRRDLKQMQINLLSISPKKILERGFGLISDESEKKVLTSITQIKIGDQISISLRDGQALAKVLSTKEKSYE